MVKVFHQPKAHNSCAAAGYIAVTGKITENLYSKQDCRKNERQSLKSFHVIVDPVHGNANRVSDDYFFKETPLNNDLDIGKNLDDLSIGRC